MMKNKHSLLHVFLINNVNIKTTGDIAKKYIQIAKLLVGFPSLPAPNMQKQTVIIINIDLNKEIS